MSMQPRPEDFEFSDELYGVIVGGISDADNLDEVVPFSDEELDHVRNHHVINTQDKRLFATMDRLAQEVERLRIALAKAEDARDRNAATIVRRAAEVERLRRIESELSALHFRVRWLDSDDHPAHTYERDPGGPGCVCKTWDCPVLAALTPSVEGGERG